MSVCSTSISNRPKYSQATGESASVISITLLVATSSASAFSMLDAWLVPPVNAKLFILGWA